MPMTYDPSVILQVMRGRQAAREQESEQQAALQRQFMALQGQRQAEADRYGYQSALSLQEGELQAQRDTARYQRDAELFERQIAGRLAEQQIEQRAREKQLQQEAGYQEQRDYRLAGIAQERLGQEQEFQWQRDVAGQMHDVNMFDMAQRGREAMEEILQRDKLGILDLEHQWKADELRELKQWEDDERIAEGIIKGTYRLPKGIKEQLDLGEQAIAKIISSRSLSQEQKEILIQRVKEDNLRLRRQAIPVPYEEQQAMLMASGELKRQKYIAGLPKELQHLGNLITVGDDGNLMLPRGMPAEAFKSLLGRQVAPLSSETLSKVLIEDPNYPGVAYWQDPDTGKITMVDRRTTGTGGDSELATTKRESASLKLRADTWRQVKEEYGYQVDKEGIESFAGPTADALRRWVEERNTAGQMNVPDEKTGAIRPLTPEEVDREVNRLLHQSMMADFNSRMNPESVPPLEPLDTTRYDESGRPIQPTVAAPPPEPEIQQQQPGVVGQFLRGAAGGVAGGPAMGIGVGVQQPGQRPQAPPQTTPRPLPESKDMLIEGALYVHPRHGIVRYRNGQWEKI